MSTTIRRAMACSVLVLAASQATATVPTAFAAGTAVTGIIEQLKVAISQLTDQLDNRVSARSFQLRTELVVLQGEMAHSADALAGKTFGELSKQQQVFFEGVATAINQTSATLADTTKDVDIIATKVEQIAAQFPFVGEEPRVRRSAPSYVKRTTPSDAPVPVTVEGSFLKHGSVSLSFGSSSCKVVGHTESKATFSCPSSLFAGTDSRVAFTSATFQVEPERSVMETVKSIFGWKKAPKKYALPIAVVPPVLGTYHVAVTHLADATESQSRQGAWGRTNDHCVDRQSFQYNFGPSGPGWRIDVGSVHTSETCGRGGQGHALRNASEAGFQIESWSRNSGRCERVLGTTVAWDARGCSAGTVTWSENKVTPVRRETVTGAGPLEWGRSVTIPLPQRLEGILVTVDQIDGKRVALNGALPSRWFSVLRDAASTSLVIAPQELAQALVVPH